MTKWLQAARRDARLASARKDPNAKIEFVAEFMWNSYTSRVSGPRVVGAPGSLWDDVDEETARIYLGHATAALRAIDILRDPSDA